MISDRVVEISNYGRVDYLFCKNALLLFGFMNSVKKYINKRLKTNITY